MTILIVEDNLDFIELLQELIKEAVPTSVLTICRSTAAAQTALQGEAFDFIILDRHIPSSDDALDARVEHGALLYQQIRSRFPGTPLCFVTGFASTDFFYSRIADAQTVDIWGNGAPEPLISVIAKADAPNIAAVVRHHADELIACNQIEIDSPIQLARLEKRVLRIFARQRASRSVQVAPLAGGMSGMRVLRIVFKNAAGAPTLTCVARIGEQTEIADEKRGYYESVIALPNGTYAALNGDCFFGAGDKAGIFYTLIANFSSLLKLIQSDENAAAGMVRQLRTNSLNWTQGHPHREMTVGQLRRLQLNDEQFAMFSQELDGIDLGQIEEFPVQVKFTPQHGDMHAENVLVVDGRTVLIDYGRVGSASSCLDPVTLELAFLFHPDCKFLVGDWPSSEHAQIWPNVEQYVAACPFKVLIREIREWGLDAAQGRRCLFATVYSVAVRQLKFPGTDRRLIRALVQMSVDAIQDT